MKVESPVKMMRTPEKKVKKQPKFIPKKMPLPVVSLYVLFITPTEKHFIQWILSKQKGDYMNMKI